MQSVSRRQHLQIKNKRKEMGWSETDKNKDAKILGFTSPKQCFSAEALKSMEANIF